MRKTLVVAADASRARIYRFEESGDTFDRKQIFELVSALDEPARRKPVGELFSQTRPGSFRTPTGRGYNPTGKREHYLDELDRSFARRIAESVREQLADRTLTRLIVAASPNMLGVLRPRLDELAARGVAVIELDRDLSRAPAPALHRQLAARGVLPPPARAA